MLKNFFSSQQVKQFLTTNVALILCLLSGRRVLRAERRRPLSAALLRAVGEDGEAKEGRAGEGDPAEGR